MLAFFSSNNIPYLKINQTCIVNNQRSNENGEHWLALINTPKGTYCYDSFNSKVNLLSPYFQNKNWLSANNDRDEPYNEATCGQRCYSWIISFLKYGDVICDII